MCKKLGPDLDTDEVYSGTAKQDREFFVRAVGVGACSAGIIWYVDGNCDFCYFAFHESAGNESRSKLAEYQEWERNLPSGSNLKMLRAVFGQKTPIYTYAKCDKAGWVVSPDRYPKIVQDSKTIDFYPFSTKEGEVLVNGRSVRDYEKSK